MGLKHLLSIKLVTRLGLFFVLMLTLGMLVMGLMLQYSPSTKFIVIGGLLAMVMAFPVGITVIRWVMRPVLDFQVDVEGLLKTEKTLGGHLNEVTSLKTTLNELVSRSQDRIRALESERSKVSAILDSMVEGVIALDHQNRVMVMNPAARRILGVASETVQNKQLLEVIRNRQLADLGEKGLTLNSDDQYRQEVEIHMPAHRILDVNAMMLPLEAGNLGTLLVLHDITELRRLERMRVEFVANVSHELRTPLTAIKGYLETLLDEAPSEPAMHRRFLEIAHTHADRLGRLIKDLLNLSDIETGRVALHLTNVGICEFVNETLTIFEKVVIAKSIAFENRIDPNLCIKADPDRLSQILVNLIDNAVKYSPSGGKVTFEARPLPEEKIGIRVTDSGQGIPPQDLARVTERFYRVDKARSREEGGTGLGLAIVKHLVQLHGGTLRISSEVGKGTIVDLILPEAQLSPSV